MKYCIYCGKELNDSDRFCVACGKEVEDKIISEKITSKKHNTLSIIALVLMILSAVSAAIGVILSIVNFKYIIEFKFSLTGLTLGGVVGSLIMCILSIWVSLTYNKEIKEGNVTITTKVLAFIVNFISGVLILIDNEHK